LAYKGLLILSDTVLHHSSSRSGSPPASLTGLITRSWCGQDQNSRNTTLPRLRIDVGLLVVCPSIQAVPSLPIITGVPVNGSPDIERCETSEIIGGVQLAHPSHRHRLLCRVTLLSRSRRLYSKPDEHGKGAGEHIARHWHVISKFTKGGPGSSPMKRAVP